MDVLIVYMRDACRRCVLVAERVERRSSGQQLQSLLNAQCTCPALQFFNTSLLPLSGEAYKHGYSRDLYPCQNSGLQYGRSGKALLVR